MNVPVVMDHEEFIPLGNSGFAGLGSLQDKRTDCNLSGSVVFGGHKDCPRGYFKDQIPEEEFGRSGIDQICI